MYMRDPKPQIVNKEASNSTPKTVMNVEANPGPNPAGNYGLDIPGTCDKPGAELIFRLHQAAAQRKFGPSRPKTQQKPKVKGTARRPDERDISQFFHLGGDKTDIGSDLAKNFGPNRHSNQQQLAEMDHRTRQPGPPSNSKKIIAPD